MAILTVYYRHKTNGTWRYSALGVGRRSEAAKHGPYFIRVRNGAGKYQWVKHQSEAAAKEAAKLAPVAQKAQELGLTIDETTNTANVSRTWIKTAIEPKYDGSTSVRCFRPSVGTRSTTPRLIVYAGVHLIEKRGEHRRLDDLPWRACFAGFSGVYRASSKARHTPPVFPGPTKRECSWLAERTGFELMVYFRRTNLQFLAKNSRFF